MQLEHMQITEWAKQNQDAPLLHTLSFFEKTLHDKERMNAMLGWCMDYLEGLSCHGLLTPLERDVFGRELMAVALHTNSIWLTYVIGEEGGNHV